MKQNVSEEAPKVTSSIIGISEASEKARKDLAETIAFQHKIISNLEAEVKTLEAQFKKLNTATSDPKVYEARQEASKAFKEVRAELNAERQALEELEKQQASYTQKTTMLRTQIAGVKDEMQKLRLEGKQESERYQELQAKLGELGTAYRAVQAEQKALTMGGQQMAGVISGISALSGALSAGMGAIGLFNNKSEKMAEIQTKVQSLMAITIGLQQISNTLHSTSAFRITTVTKAKELWAAANLKVAATLSITNVQAQFLMATLTLGLSVAITAVVAGLSVLISRSREAAKEQGEMNKAIADTAAKSIAEHAKLQQSYKTLGDSLQEKKKFIEQNKKAFDQLGVSINSVNDADNLFITNTDAFKTALLERAKAAAAFEMATEKIKQAQLKEQEASIREKTPTGRDRATSSNDVFYRDGKEVLLNKRAVSEAADDFAEADKLMKEAEDMIVKSVGFSNKATKIINDAGLNSSESIVEGTKAFWDAQQRAALTALESFKDVDKGSKDWNVAVERYNKATAKLKMWDLSPKKENDSSSQFLEKATSTQLALEKSRLEIMRDGREKELEEIKLSTKQKLAEIDKQEQQLVAAYKKVGKSISSEEVANFAERRVNAEIAATNESDEVNKKHFDDLKSRQSNLMEVFLTDEQKKLKTIEDRYNKEREWAQKQFTGGGMTKEQYDNFLILVDSAEVESALLDFKDKYKTIADQITEIEKQAALDRAKATTDAQKGMVDEWEKSQKSKLVSQDLMKDGSFGTLIGNLDRLGTSKISGALSSAKDKLKTAQEGGELTPTDFKTLIDAIEKGEEVVRKRNPFKALSEAVKEYKKQPKGKKDIKDIALSAAEGFSMVSGSLTAVVDGLKKMGIAGDEETQAMLGSMIELTESAATLAKGIAEGNPVAIVQGAIGIITSVFEVFDKKSRDASREVKKHGEAIKQLQKEYQALEQAIKSAFSTDYYAKQIEQARNLEAQIRKTYAMISAEQSKRKKKIDQEKIDQWKADIEDLKNQAADIRRAVIDELMTTDLRSFSSSLASSVIQGYTEGMEDMGSIVQGSMDDLMRSMLAKQFDILVAQKLLKPVFDEMERSIDVDKGDFTIDQSDLQRIKQANDIAKGGLLTAGESYRKMLEDLGLMGSEAQRQGASKGIAQASQESITELTGGVYSLRLTTADIRDISREQVLIMRTYKDMFERIVENTEYCRYLVDVKNSLEEIKTRGIIIKG